MKNKLRRRLASHSNCKHYFMTVFSALVIKQHQKIMIVTTTRKLLKINKQRFLNRVLNEP